MKIIINHSFYSNRLSLIMFLVNDSLITVLVLFKFYHNFYTFSIEVTTKASFNSLMPVFLMVYLLLPSIWKSQSEIIKESQGNLKKQNN